MGKIAYYTIYLRKNDEIVASGTAKECARQMGKKPKDILYIASNSKYGRNNKYDVLVERVEKSETGYV